MATLERFMQMQQQGISDQQIMQTLKDEGVSPREIMEAASQSKIKSAISNENPMQQENMPHDINDDFQTSREPGMEGSVMNPQDYAGNEQYQQPYPAPTPEQNQSQMPQQEAYPMQDFYPDYQQQYQEYQPQQGVDIETINEIVDQVTEEKTEKLKKQIEPFTKFKEELTVKFENISQRLVKIETTIEELQRSIIRKMGSYGEDIQNISREMHATQESFSKILNPLADNMQELREMKGHHTQHQQSSHQHAHPNESQTHQHQHSKENLPELPQHKGKSKPGFEDFLR